MIPKAKASVLMVLAWLLSLNAHSACKVFDGTMYNGKPRVLRGIFPTVSIVYESWVWPSVESRKELPDKRKFESRLRMLKSSSGLAILDIEAWPVRGYRYKPWVVESSLDKYLVLMDWAEKGRPDLKWGMFGLVLPNNYPASVSDPKSRKYDWWQKENDRMVRLVKRTKLVFPSFYTYEKDPAQWLKSVQAKRKELGRLYDGPVYPFIWPQYYDHKPADPALWLKYIPGDFWRMQLETVCRIADGVVIWGGWDFEKRRRAKWDESAEWWKVTRKFILENSSVQ